MCFAKDGLKRGDKKLILKTKVTYIESARLTLQPLGVDLNVYNATSTQPTYEERLGKMEISLDHLWKVWLNEIEAQGFRVEESVSSKANAVVRAYRYSTREHGTPNNRGAVVCYMKHKVSGQYVGIDFAGKKIQFDQDKHIAEFYVETEKHTIEAHFADRYIRITRS